MRSLTARGSGKAPVRATFNALTPGGGALDTTAMYAKHESLKEVNERET